MVYVPNKKILRYKLSFQSADHTMTNEKCAAIKRRIMSALAKKFGATAPKAGEIYWDSYSPREVTDANQA